LQSGGLLDDPHWFPQSCFVTCGFESLNFIGKVETLQKDLIHILDCLEIENNGKVQRFSPHKTDSTKKLDLLFNEQTIEIVSQVYHDDFINFGYSKKPFWLDI
jgi:hypothetical protein